MKERDDPVFPNKSFEGKTSVILSAKPFYLLESTN
jgi:hypothetical protein